MNYTALIENRKSVRAFREEAVPDSAVEQIRAYYHDGCRRLVPDVETELVVLDTDARDALEGSAGYEDFLVGAPHYLVLLSAEHEYAVENAGYMMEDLILKLAEMGLDSCFLTFRDGEKVKKTLGLPFDLKIAAIAAFGYGEKTAKKIRLNILNMSNVDVSAQRGYYSHKKNIEDLVSVEKLGCTDGLDELMGFYDDMLWQSFYAAAQAPSYLNRQPYAFLLKGHELLLVRLADKYTDDVSAKLNLGVVMLHFAAVAGQWVGNRNWQLGAKADAALPEGCSVEAVYAI